MLGELPALIAAGYEQVPEEDLVRLKWWGLYHDKPKIGTFMLRIKLPAGRVTPEQLQAVGELSLQYGKGSGELSTRQTIQLHYLELESLPEVFRRLDEVGLTTVGACGDAVRNVTGCPVAGLAHDELFDVTPVVEAVTTFFYGNPDYSDLPRKHKITISACAHRCNAPEINCIALVGALRDGEPGLRRPRRRRPLVGAAARARPRRLHPRRRGAARAVRAARRVEGRPPVPRLAREGAAQVHGRRPRAGGHARRGRAAARLRAAGLRARRPAADDRPHRRRAAEAGGPRLDRRAGQGRPRLGRADGRGRGACGGGRPGRARHEAAELRPHLRRDRGRRACRRAAGGARPAADRQPAPRRGDRLHRRAVLQLRRRRDQVAARRPRRAARGPLRRRPRRAEAESRRLPPRVRPPLGGRPRLPGLDRAQRGRCAAPGLRRAAARRPRPGCGDRPRGLPPCAGRGARRHGRRPARRVAGAARGRGELPGVLRPLERRRARRPRRARAGKESTRGGGGA